MEGRRPKHVRDTAQRQWLRERTNDQRLCSLREVSVCGQRAWALRPGRGRGTPESVAHERKCFLLRRPFADRSGPQPTDEDVAPEECPSVVRRMNRAQSAASEPLEQIRLYADKDAMVPGHSRGAGGTAGRRRRTPCGWAWSAPTPCRPAR